jgi:hypothetical protein
MDGAASQGKMGSLGEFLATGRLGRQWLGLTRDEIAGHLGLPEAVGGTSSRRRVPSIYKYGDVEFHFAPASPFLCALIHIEGFTGGGPLSADARRSDVLRYLDSLNLAYDECAPVSGGRASIRVSPSGVVITFEEDDRLAALSLSERGES